MSSSNGYLTIEKDISPDVEKELKKIAKQIVKANKKIIELGYSSYLSAQGNWNIMDGSSHVGVGASPNRDAVIATFSLDCIDGGDW